MVIRVVGWIVEEDLEVRCQDIQPKQGHLLLLCGSVGGARAQPLTYAEYKAMKAAKAAAAAGR